MDSRCPRSRCAACPTTPVTASFSGGTRGDVVDDGDQFVQPVAVMAGEEHEFGAGDTVLRQGERGADAFVILSGHALVVRDGREVARLGAGQFFGEVAMLDGRPRTADVVADSRLRCVALSRETVKGALRAEPDLAWRVLEVLAGRIRG